MRWVASDIFDEWLVVRAQAGEDDAMRKLVAYGEDTLVLHRIRLFYQFVYVVHQCVLSMRQSSSSKTSEISFMTHSHRPTFLLLALLALSGFGWVAFSASTPTGAADHHSTSESDKLTIVWTSGDPDVAHRMVLMYANGAQQREWFDDITLIIWGPSQRFVAADKDIRAKLQNLMDIGVNVYACQACSDSYGITDDLRSVGMTVKYMGEPLSDAIKGDSHVITF